MYQVGDFVRFCTTSIDEMYGWSTVGWIIKIYCNKDGNPVEYIIENKMMKYGINPSYVIGKEDYEKLKREIEGRIPS